MPRLSNQGTSSGYTDIFRVTHSDLTETADDTAQTLTYGISPGDVVEAVDMIIITEFDDTGGGDELDVVVGDGNDPDGYLPSAAANADLHADQGPTAVVKGAGALVTASGTLYAAADTLDFVFTPNRATGQSYSLSELDTGEVLFLLRIRRLADHGTPAS